MSGSSVDGEINIPLEISQLQEKLLVNPLFVDVIIESRAVGGNTDAQNGSHQRENGSKEKLLHFYSNITQNLSQLDKVLNQDHNTKTHIILVVDRSGSMSGNPFSQVKNALTQIVGQCLNDPNKAADIVLYAEKADIVSFTSSTYKEAISGLNAYGSTSFKAAFDAVDALLATRESKSFDATVILFLTDGVDTISHQSKANEYAKKWAKSLKTFAHQVTVHAIGFSKDHDLQFLTKIAHAGSVQGLYRYCEPGDGSEALRDKLEELFDYVSVSEGRPIKFEVHLENPGDHLFCLDHQSEMIDGIIKQTESDIGVQVLTASADCWVYTETPNNEIKFSLSMHIVIKKNNFKFTLHIPCQIKTIKNEVLKDMSEIAVWDLSIMSRDSDVLMTDFVSAIAAQKDVPVLKGRLDRMQSQISKVDVFKHGYNKETRAQIMSHIKDIQGKLNKLHGMLAQYLRGETQGVSLLARAQDLRYEAQFSKVRRQRLMDRRVAANFSLMKSDATRCAAASEEELGELSEEALGYFYCILSMCNVKEILLDDTNMENALGLGLAVTRPEHVVDNPTSIHIHSISGSFVSRCSVMDALEFKINLESHLSAHGGFSFKYDSSSELPFATVGSGREPINAWLPLYICPSHWERVKTLLCPSLGYLCTLDPLGFSDNQIDIIFMVLGCMICQVLDAKAGENQLKVIFAIQRTCQACIEEYNLTAKIIDVVKSFLESPLGRFRHAVPNLQTLIGYLVSLPVSTTRHLLGVTEVGCNDFSTNSKLLLAFTAEVIRRASNSLPHLHANDNVVNSLLSLIIQGQQLNVGVTEIKTSEVPMSIYLGHLCEQLMMDEEEDRDTFLIQEYNPNAELTNEKEGSDKFVIPQYNPGAELSAPYVQIHQSPKVDKAMAIWAQAQCGNIKNKNHNEKIKEARKIVREWVSLVRQKIGLPVDEKETNSDTSDVETKTDPHEFDNTAVNTSILEIVAKLLCQFSKKCYPSLSSIVSAFGFLHCWLKLEDRHSGTDRNTCLPSNEWIKEIKSTMSVILEKLKEIEHQQSVVEELVVVEREDTPQKHVDYEENVDDVTRVVNNEQEPEVLEDKEIVDSGIKNKLTARCRQRQLITLPMLLAALNVPGDHTELIRAMLCQAVSSPSNTQARDAVHSGEMLDLSQAGNAHTYLCNIRKDLNKRKEAAAKKLAEKAAWEIGNLSMLRAGSLWSFVGYLLKTHKERGEGFSALISFILECPGVLGFPLLAEKVLILLLGKYQGCVVFARGNSWIPDKKMSLGLEKVLGEEVWRNIERELLSDVHVHVYRESDIPNRQGHCNSNPYIPNRIRQILGMPLIDEKNKQSAKKHTEPKQ